MRINQILEKKKEEIKEAKFLRSFDEVMKSADDKRRDVKEGGISGNVTFLGALKGDSLSKVNAVNTTIIAEIKSASPSLGVIRENFFPKEIAKTYESHGASAISVLTTRYGFNGDIEYLKDVKGCVDIPVLRKDFIFDEYQIYESAAFGADALLLIASILEKKQLKDYLELSKVLGMDALVEVHTFEDMEKTVDCNPDIIGINNRDLKTFDVDINTTLELIKEIPDDKVVISESGIKSRKDIKYFETNGVDAFLIGTALMASDDIGSELDKLLYD